MTYSAHILLAATLLLTACGSDTDTNADDADTKSGNAEEKTETEINMEVQSGAVSFAEAEARAQEAVTALTQTLGSELMKSMKEGGPVHAVEYCAGQAQQVTVKLAAEMGLYLRRVSEKARNPADRPDVYETAVLADFQSMAEFGQLEAGSFHSEVVTVDGEEVLRYLKPLTIKPKCLPCHGGAEQIPPEIAEVLSERYPQDAATGYQAGDLRGAVSVIVSLRDH